jgi:arabinogalactan oligomer/maltooligosaccharide transport system permease protein
MESLNIEVLSRSLGEIGSTLFFLVAAIVAIELIIYFLWRPLGAFARSIDRWLRFLPNWLRHLISTVLIVGVIVFVVGAISVGQETSPWVSYWPLAVVALLAGMFISPNTPTIFRHEFRLSYMLLIPAIIGLMMLVVFPLLWEINVSMTNLSPKHFKSPDFVGLRNYVDVFTKPVLKQVTFFPVFFRTVLWTAINVFFHVTLGMALALLLNRPLRLRGIYRTILVLPWAVPQPIAALAWRGEFHYEYGFPNIMIRRLAELMPWLGLAAIQWKTNPTANFAAMLITNIWLGIPFMMIIILGGLQSISPEYYEAAELDGAGSAQQFRHVTLPLLRPVLTPAIILGTIWTFNNFNIPFFINENELETSDTLVTALFRSAFQYFNLGDAAAFAFVLFGILLVFSIVYIRATGGLKGAYE